VGGGLGQDGENGIGGGGLASDPGSGGDAIDANGFTITYTLTGDIRGAVIP